MRWGCEKSSEKTAVGSGVTFKYEPFGKRIEKTTSSTTSIYAYDGGNLIEETNAAGGVVAGYAQGHDIVEIDEPLAMLRSSTTSYYHSKQAGEELGVKEELVSRDLGRMLWKLEELQRQRIQKALEPKEEEVQLCEDERAAAMELLCDPNLLPEIPIAIT